VLNDVTTARPAVPVVQVSSAASVIVTPGYAFNAHDNAEMSCLSLSSNPRLIWLKNGVQLQNTTGKYSISANGVLEVIRVDEADVGPLYTCEDISTNPPGRANVTLNAVAVSNQTSTLNITKGQDLVLTCNTWGYPVPTIIWYYKGQALTGSNYQLSNIQTPHNGYTLTGGKLTVHNAQATDSGAYTCNVQNTFADLNGTTQVTVTDPSREAVVKTPVSPSLPTVPNPPAAQLIPTNGYALLPFTDVEISCLSLGGDTSTALRWFKDGVEILNRAGKYQLTPATGSLTINRVGETDIGEYTCQLGSSRANATVYEEVFM
jgi:hypothetical protein